MHTILLLSTQSYGLPDMDQHGNIDSYVIGFFDVFVREHNYKYMQLLDHTT